MDLDPFEAIGIHPRTVRLLDVFLLHCLLSDSPPDTPEEIAAVGGNQHAVAARGREPGLRLSRKNRTIPLREWGGEILSECRPIAEALDAANGGGDAHREALAHGEALLGDPSLAPSARVLHELARNHDNVYARFGAVQSLLHAGYIRGLPFPPAEERRFAELARESIEEQKSVEASDKDDFETYRRKYLAQDTLLVGEPRYREDR